MPTIYQETLDQILFLYERYSKEHRASTQPFHLKKVRELVPNYTYDTDDLLVRESLIEHCGSLPIVATALYPHLTTNDVDLGKALTMLAIHDIGELVTGDENVFTKIQSKADEERKHALNLLPMQYHDIYLEVEELSTNTARFAKAVDKLTPDLLDLMNTPEVTIKRFADTLKKAPKEIVPLIMEYKHPFMVWDEFMEHFHLEILDRLDKQLTPYY